MAEAPWDLAEPLCDQQGGACYSHVLKADLRPGTFVLMMGRSSTTSAPLDQDRDDVVARIVSVVRSQEPSSVRVNIFRHMKEAQQTEGFLRPNRLSENHLRHVTEIIQTTELRVVSTRDIVNLAFVFTMEALQDPSNFFSSCQGMILAFVLRFRFVPNNRGEPLLDEVQDGYCLPFPSSYRSSMYHDCFARRVWNNIISIKLEITKLLGRYSQNQGLFTREQGRLPNITKETWGFLKLQFANFFDDSGSGMSCRVRVHRVIESGGVVKAIRVKKTCTVLQFETVAHLQQLCNVFGDGVTAGQRCRLPKVSAPKTLWINDLINVVCGSGEPEPVFNKRTAQDGVDLAYDGSTELFVTLRYRRYAYDTSLEGCDPLLASLLRRQSLFSKHEDEDDGEMPIILIGSELEDSNGCLYRVVGLADVRSVLARCFHPRLNNPRYGKEKVIDIDLANELIQQRLN